MKKNNMSLDLRFPNLIEMLRSQASQRPEAELYTFLTDGENKQERMTFGGLDLWARKIAAELQERGLAGQRAVLLYPPGLEYIAGFMGCIYAGVVAVPAYPPDPNRLERTLPRLQAIIADCQAKVILSTEAICSMAQFLATQAPDLGGLQWIATDSLKDSRAEQWQLPEIHGATLAFLQYTSGSTGHPKGVMLSHENLIHNLAVIQNGFRVNPNDRGIIWLPPYHDMGLIGGILGGLYSGIPVTLLSPLHFLQNPIRWLKAISRFRGTITGGPNFAYEMCVKKVTSDQIKELDLSTWSLAFTGAESIQPATLERFSNTFKPCGFRSEIFYPCYGLAEGTLMVTGGERAKGAKTLTLAEERYREQKISEHNPASAKQVELAGCGTVFPGHCIKIIRPDTQTPCAEGDIGEIWVQGPSIAQGYWNQPDKSQEVFRASPQGETDQAWLRTGDLGFLEGEELFVTGRLKDLIIVRGQNHYPQDIERTMEGCHEAFRPGCSAAFSVKEGYEEKLVLFQEVDTRRYPFSEPEFADISQQVAAAISHHHDLEAHRIVFLNKGDLPKTSSGKIRRFECREQWLAGATGAIWSWQRPEKESIPSEGKKEAKSSPNPPIEELLPSPENILPWLSQRLAQHLDVPVHEVDPTVPLAMYGLDSKEAVGLSGDLEQWLGCQLSPAILWKYPTIEDLAQYLSSDEVVQPPREASG